MNSTLNIRPGRPPATDHDAIERVAFALFAERGFDATTIDDIAAAAGIGRRTLFRYDPSKNDIPWGQFDESLVRLRAHLEAMAPDMPVYRAVHEAVLAFNHLEPAAIPQHRQRMRLLLSTPALHADDIQKRTGTGYPPPHDVPCRQRARRWPPPACPWRRFRRTWPLSTAWPPPT